MKKILLGIAFLSLFFALFAYALPDGGNDDKGPLTKLTFVHYKKSFAKPPGTPGGGKGGSACYGFLANGAKWKHPENYLVNPSYSNLSDAFVLNSMVSGASEWESQGANIFESGSIDYSAYYDESSMDNNNTASFGYYSQPGVIAVTNVWGYFYGAPKTREIVEWDMLFNIQYSWGNASENQLLMDLQNIATHELGHSAGMGDLYEVSCQEETMYGYSQEGETKKRDLNAGDITGIKKLYGA
ncbi:MAG: matrixin family metalloprotease [Candidatus Micrarchaeota archaeon]